MKKLILISGSLLMAGSLSAQDSAPKTFMDDPIHHPLFPLFMISLFVFVVVILVLVSAVILLRVLNVMVRNAAIENAARQGIPYAPQQTWWEKLWFDINAMKPIEEDKNIELDHNYDGIKELDNHLPPWWKWLFYATIVWGVVYFVAYHVSYSLPLSGEEYQNELAVAEEQARVLKASQPVAVIDENTLAFTNDADIIAKGKTVFMSNNCGSCHRNDGGGNMVGPNLTDEYWLNGGEIKNLFLTVKNGRVEKGMPAWGKVMSQQDVRDVTFYVMSLQGTNPVDAKAPQGEKYIPKETAPVTDSTQVQASLIK
jgi:cytochrome c oxidase cbb3-type subunit III